MLDSCWPPVYTGRKLVHSVYKQTREKAQHSPRPMTKTRLNSQISITLNMAQAERGHADLSSGANRRLDSIHSISSDVQLVAINKLS